MVGKFFYRSYRSCSCISGFGDSEFWFFHTLKPLFRGKNLFHISTHILKTDDLYYIYYCDIYIIVRTSIPLRKTRGCFEWCQKRAFFEVSFFANFAVFDWSPGRFVRGVVFTVYSFYPRNYVLYWTYLPKNTYDTPCSWVVGRSTYESWAGCFIIDEEKGRPGPMQTCQVKCTQASRIDL